MSVHPADEAAQDARIDFRIPFAVRLGVVGHFASPGEEHVRAGVRTVLHRLDEILRRTPHSFTVVSSCIDEAFEPVVEEILAESVEMHRQQSRYTAVLSVSPAECIAQLETDRERECLTRLLNRAASVDVFEGQKEVPAPHEEIGKHIINSCDVLLAVWDGVNSPEPGGTARLVRYARTIGRTLFWIHSVTGNVVEERHGDGILESFEDLNAYNSEKVADAQMARALAERERWLAGKMQISGLPAELVKPLARTMLPDYTRARLLSARYQKRYMRAGTAVYALAALAVATVTTQTLFFPEYPWLLWFEVAEISIILLLLMASRIGEWHRKWIDYRFLTERIRAGFFMSILCVRCEKPATPRHLSLSHRSNDWMLLAFEGILDRRPLEYCSIQIPFEPLKTFLLAAWIDNRLACFMRHSERNRQRYIIISEIGEILFAVTLVAAAIHAAGLHPPSAVPVLDHPYSLVAITIILPALGAALAGIRVQREYLRNAERYAHMVQHLSTISSQIKRAETRVELDALLKEANEVTLREQQDWRIIFLFRDLETP
ncbi:hypothetical protein FGU65_03065 [Methanoculleus sp. FWC-SCC1]|uniref:SMODS and SLOG-associating 2TM effector domain-containing protein n=1 Tax=Methanoculleus frigidifontis TaxID=2584085 RepID=A0ABT8M7I5_9EURY|nr:hypothetical protein [Methanoculleus sp. FWC-SCC1]MDN7023881.1 hypothetical protein [Methanoculleus sp. FWC-SCC1]